MNFLSALGHGWIPIKINIDAVFIRKSLSKALENVYVPK